MTDANLDHLLTVTAPRSNWQAPSPTVSRGEQPAFDDHLTQASTPQAPIERPRARDEWMPESDPPDDRFPQQEASSVTPNSDSQDDNFVNEKTDSEAIASESNEAEAAVTNHGAEQANADAPDGAESVDGDDESTIELPGASDAAAVVLPNVAQSSHDPDNGDEVAATPGQNKSEAAGPESVDSPVASPKADKVLLAEVPAAAVDAKPAAPTNKAAGTVQTNIGTARSAAEHQTISKHGTSNVDRPTAASKRRAAPEGDSESASDAPAVSSGENTQQADAQPNAEQRDVKLEQIADGPRQTDTPRPVMSRQAVRQDGSNNVVQTPLAVAINGATAEAATETTKPEATDESVRLTTHNAPRTDALLHPLTRLGRSGAAAAGAGSQGDANSEEAPRVDAARFVSRVAKAFHTAQERGGALQLRLSPPELGSLRLELLVQDGVLAAKLEAETPAARRVLLDHLPALRDRLAEQNIRIERFDVDVRQEGGGHSPSSPQHGRHQQSHQGSPHRLPSRQPVSTAEPSPAAPAAIGLATDTQINLVA